MATTLKLRTATAGGVCTVRALIRHPMETGGRKNAQTGQLIPAHHITELSCEHNGSTVLTCHWGTGIAKNPYLSFRFSGAKAGDILLVRWSDNLGASDSIRTVLA